MHPHNTFTDRTRLLVWDTLIELVFNWIRFYVEGYLWFFNCLVWITVCCVHGYIRVNKWMQTQIAWLWLCWNVWKIVRNKWAEGSLRLCLSVIVDTGLPNGINAYRTTKCAPQSTSSLPWLYCRHSFPCLDDYLLYYTMTFNNYNYCIQIEMLLNLIILFYADKISEFLWLFNSHKTESV